MAPDRATATGHQRCTARTREGSRRPTPARSDARTGRLTSRHELVRRRLAGPRRAHRRRRSKSVQLSITSGTTAERRHGEAARSLQQVQSQRPPGLRGSRQRPVLPLRRRAPSRRDRAQATSSGLLPSQPCRSASVLLGNRCVQSCASGGRQAAGRCVSHRSLDTAARTAVYRNSGTSVAPRRTGTRRCRRSTPRLAAAAAEADRPTGPPTARWPVDTAVARRRSGSRSLRPDPERHLERRCHCPRPEGYADEGTAKVRLCGIRSPLMRRSGSPESESESVEPTCGGITESIWALLTLDRRCYKLSWSRPSTGPYSKLLNLRTRRAGVHAAIDSPSLVEGAPSFSAASQWSAPPCARRRSPRSLRRTPAPYRVQVNDVLEFLFFKNTELNQTRTVGPDGEVSLQLVGRGAGRRPDHR